LTAYVTLPYTIAMTRTRESKLTLMLTEAELAKLRALAEGAGISMAGWVRQAINLAPEPKASTTPKRKRPRQR
jgi:hypothetical protein